MTDKELLAIAREASGRAYVPYSKFAVGAALECRGGRVFTGCNVENAALGDTICAERTACVKAISEGYRDYVRLAIYAESQNYCMPCGSCRQVMREFAPEIEVICLSGKGEARHYTLRQLLPDSFGPEYL